MAFCILPAMRLSLQVHYAICGVFDLAYNGHGQPVQVRVIGERQAIPARYLEQIFQRLRRGGLVKAKRGPGGGYTLARPAAEITLRDVVEAVEGPVDCGERARADGDGECVATRPNFLWDDLAHRFADVLGDVHIEALCQRAAQQAVERADSDAYTYQI
ncbi:MAG: Rrf2 family transcriptional regulator [Proteobacteria bacterium]|nr:Rrf2 family transcriptional regulator [Pseudomonadota bacterium]